MTSSYTYHNVFKAHPCCIKYQNFIQFGRLNNVLSKVKELIAQLCPALWDSMDCSPPGSSVNGIPWGSILE